MTAFCGSVPPSTTTRSQLALDAARQLPTGMRASAATMKGRLESDGVRVEHGEPPWGLPGGSSCASRVI
jgi:hypothetical protein